MRPDDLDAVVAQRIDLLRVVRQQADAFEAELREQRRGDVVAALVGEKAQMLVGVDGVEAAVLQHVGAQLVRQADAAPFLIEIQQHAAAERADARDGRAQLLAAIAAQAAEQIAREARRVQTHGHGARGDSGVPMTTATCSARLCSSRNTAISQSTASASGTRARLSSCSAW